MGDRRLSGSATQPPLSHFPSSHQEITTASVGLLCHTVGWVNFGCWYLAETASREVSVEQSGSDTQPVSNGVSAG
jgi:hypothetical protein